MPKLKNYAFYDAKNFQNAKFEIVFLKNVAFIIQKFFTFSTFFSKWPKFKSHMIFWLIIHDLDTPSGFVIKLCWNFEISHLMFRENKGESKSAVQKSSTKSFDQNFWILMVRARKRSHFSKDILQVYTSYKWFINRVNREVMKIFKKSKLLKVEMLKFGYRTTANEPHLYEEVFCMNS